MKKQIGIFISLMLHITAIAVIIIVFWPMATWYFDNPTLPTSGVYFEAKPLWGVDFFYTASIVNALRDNIVLPSAGWGYQWFTGWPLLSNYPIFHYYLILPFTYFFDLISAVKLWMLVSLGLFFIGLYATFSLLSRNVIFAAVLAVAAIYSVGVYGSLMWGGSLPSHATQAFLPWVVFFLLLYLKNQKSSFLLLSSLLAGLAIWGHPQIVVAYIYPFAAILFIFSFWGIKLLSRLKALFIFVGISFLIGFPLLYTSMGGALKVLLVTNSTEVASSTASIPSQLADEVTVFHRAQPARMYEDTNTTIYLSLAIAAILFLTVFLFKRQRKLFFSVLPFLILALYSAVYIWIFSYGISILHGGWYRLFWTVPFWIGLLAASLWGSAQLSLKQSLGRIFTPVLLIASLLVLIVGSFSLMYFSKETKEKIIPRSNPSSAFPDVLNLRDNVLGFKRLKKEMVPVWLDAFQTNYRLYSADQTINIWWNALYKMPLARGYLDPPFPDRGYLFWLDAALSQDPGGKDQLVGSFKYPPDIALNNTLFLIDWYALKYFEAGPTMVALTSLPKSFANSAYIKQDELMDFNKEKYNKGGMTLHYYEIKDIYTSPILLGTNASTLGIIASDTGYETLMRDLADMNLSLKQVIPVKLGQNIDKIKKNDLDAMDALIVYDYNYSNKGNAFRMLSDYVKKEGKIFIDTGVEVKEANTTDSLPEIFPIETSERKPLGKTWDFETGDSDLVKAINFSAFAPPVFNNEGWSITYPLADADVREGSNIILRNKGKPVIISYSVNGGEIIWSGINLPYHVIREHNVEEVRFFRNIIEKLLEGNSDIKEPTYEAKFINPQKRQIVFNGATGVLFKEQAFPGWSATLESGAKRQNVKVFKAGPANPGFMYVRVPTGYNQKETSISFTYGGSFATWFLSIISFLIVVFLLEEIFIGGKIIGRLRRLVWKRSHGQVKSWWGREDE